MTADNTRRRSLGEIDGFISLLRAAVAEKACEVIFRCGRPKGTR